METMQAIRSRKSVRSYTGEPPTPEQLGAILAAAQASPVAMGRYGDVRLTVVTDKGFIDGMDEAGARLFGKPGIHPLYGAPVLVVVSVNVGADDGAKNVSSANAAIVAHNMTLAATDLGVGSCLIYGATAALCADLALLARLDLPEGFAPRASVVLGQTAEPLPERDAPADRIVVDRLG